MRSAESNIRNVDFIRVKITLLNYYILTVDNLDVILFIEVNY